MWTITIQEYIKKANENLENQINRKGLELNDCAVTPMAMVYQPQIDSYPYLDQDGITTFQELIGIIRWAVEIKKVDILTEISMLSSYQAYPR